MRERVYLKLLDALSQDDIDMLQAFFITHLPEYVKESINAKSHYHVYTAVTCDLGGFHVKNIIPYCCREYLPINFVSH